MATFVKNTFSPVDVLVFFEYENSLLQCFLLFKRIQTIGERKFSLKSYDTQCSKLFFKMP